jgi:hypothetical protein
VVGRLWILGLALLCACPRGEPAPGDGPPGGGPDIGLPGPPDSSALDPCEAPARADVSQPDRVVGDGTPASCTEDALREAAGSGGIIVFDCGPDPHSIELSQTVVIRDETVLDGGGTVTLNGGGKVRILLFDSAYNLTTPRLTVQGLTFRNGRSPEGGDDTAVGGGAIYRDGGSLTVIDSLFIDNHAPSPGQDIAGGAIYAFGGGDTRIINSSFQRNSASNGGAIGSLNGDLIVLHADFVENHAAGSGGNPGDGGCGGAIYQDGADEHTRLCAVRMRNNRAGAIGGGYFRVSNHDNGTFEMDLSTVDDNHVGERGVEGRRSNAGGLYLQGLTARIDASTVSRNTAFNAGGLWISEGTYQLTNVTVAGNEATGTNGGGLWLGNDAGGRLSHVSIVDNHSTGPDKIAGAVFAIGDSRITLHNTLIANNTARWVPGCNEEHPGSGNLEWPGGANCSAAPLVADPLLSELGDFGGRTETLVPADDSPALGLGRDCAPVDQRGEKRTEPCTVGAVEVVPQ